jgi:hypothetical protein
MKKFIAILFFVLFLYPSYILASNQVDINSATLSQLDEIVHVGAKTAQKIIDGRPYGSVQDLSRIKGIGNGKDLQDIISQGLACVNCATQSTQSSEIIDSNAQTTNPNQALIPNTQNSNLTPNTQNPTPNIVYPSGVYINELLPNPEGADETDEWVVPTIQQIISVCS